MHSLLADQLNNSGWRERLAACTVVPLLHHSVNKDLCTKLLTLTWDDWSTEVQHAAAKALGGTSHAKVGKALGGTSHAKVGKALGGTSHAEVGKALGGTSHAEVGKALGGTSHAKVLTLKALEGGIAHIEGGGGCGQLTKAL